MNEFIKNQLKVLGYFKKTSKQRNLLVMNLQNWVKKNKVEIISEYKFHPDRKWRADWAIVSKKILIEYEGLFSTKSRHTTIKGFTNDTEKYNSAQVLGWKILRYTALNYLEVTKDLNKICGFD